MQFLFPADTRLAWLGSTGNSGLKALDVLSFGAFIAINELVTDLISFAQRLIAGANDGRVMNKNVLSGLTGYETPTTFIIEPFYLSTGHTFFLPCPRFTTGGSDSFLLEASVSQPSFHSQFLASLHMVIRQDIRKHS
jgi:hypothetical protein